MKITINTEVLQRHNLTFGEFLVMLMGYYDIKYKESLDDLVRDKVIQLNVFNKDELVLSNNTRDLVTKILLESDDKVRESNIDFTLLAEKLQAIYPSGCKAGTSHSWRGETEDIAQKLRALVVMHHFSFTEEEAIKATEEYVESYGEECQHMQLLKYFILRTKRQDDDSVEIDSMFMTIIENNR